VAPKQCPECGRFLKNAVIQALGDRGAACPRCGSTLTAAMFEDEVLTGGRTIPVPAGGSGDDPGDGGPLEEPEVPELHEVNEVHEVSVRPPDLEPDAVRDRTLDVLAGWDVGVGEAEIAAWRQDRRPFPTDTVSLIGAGATGLLLGLLLVPQHRVRGASLGALAGVVGAAIVRQVWLLRA
jgi:hypothetical protein